jgi:beta-lactam-binding protein with PASTA domain
MRRFFTLVLGALAMVAVALLSAFIAMRLAIHGREAVVPGLTGLTVAEAMERAGSKGLHLDLENRFYSTEVAAGRVLAQDPPAGERVRREWPVRITESLGTQRVNIPDLTGESERAATVNIHRLSLELGTEAYLAVPGDAGVVLTQTPPANSAGVDGPRVRLLVSDVEDAAPQAYVMPSLLGLTYAAASARAGAAGLRVASAVDTTVAGSAPGATANAGSQPPGSAGQPLGGSAGKGSEEDDFIAANALESPPNGSAVVISQTPLPGRRVVEGDAVRVVLGHPVASGVAGAQ